MKKIPSIFMRDHSGNRLLYDEINPICSWVFNGEGIPTRKFDGTCCLIKDGRLWRRRNVKNGSIAPEDFVPADDPDPITGNTFGWIPVGYSNSDRIHREALSLHDGDLLDGTYELCGPKINGNPDRFHSHQLIRHGLERIDDLAGMQINFSSLKAYLADADMEGIVWHHPDGRMAKIKTKDFGLSRKKASG
jgi:hypothetical protein